jgi:hypothetical protein
VAFWAPLLLPAIGALASGTEIISLWSMSAWTLLPVLLLSLDGVSLREVDTRRLVAVAVAVPLLALLVSPLIAINVQRHGPPPASAHANLLASEVERLWRLTTPLPLRFVGGDAELTDGVATYAVDRPRLLTGMPAPGAAVLAHSGRAIICFAEDAHCRGLAPANAQRVESDIVRNFLRQAGKAQRYTIFIVPPQP